MKKVIFSFLLCAVFLMTACTTQQEPQNTDATRIKEVFSSLEANIFLTSKEEFGAFMAGDGAKLPKSFVTWEEISVFGKVEAFVQFGGEYAYSLTDPAGHRLHIDIYHSPVIFAQPIIPLSDVTMSSSGYREVAYDYNGDVDFYLLRNGVEYSYDRGTNKLGAIQYYVDGIQLIITMSGGFSKYPARTDTIIGKLLSADDSVANAAFAEIKEQLSK